ncbi:MAG: hypothetical protein N4A36_01270 [Candidatus Gracilibacteria bacterium]|jgi:hypothetical protein|nr:hypothetical protein [Candidatus Gracilibacteria bacterium]
MERVRNDVFPEDGGSPDFMARSIAEIENPAQKAVLEVMDCNGVNQEIRFAAYDAIGRAERDGDIDSIGKIAGAVREGRGISDILAICPKKIPDDDIFAELL